MTTFAESFCYKSGRFALYYLLMHLKQVAGLTKIMMPAYHCPSMIEPCSWAGVDVVLYKLDSALRPDVSDMQEKVRLLRPEVMVVVHYFGMPAPAMTIRELPELRDLVLVEDAAHVIPGEFAHSSAYTLAGDWLLESPRKHLPVFDGGIMRSRERLNDTRNIVAAPARLLDEARSAKYALESVITRNNTGQKTAVQSSALMPNTSPQRASEVPDLAASDYIDSRFRLTGRDGMTIVSRGLCAIISSSTRAARRRANYQSLQLACSKLKAVAPLYPELPPGVVPYAYPLLLDDAERRYKLLRDAGIRVFRWEGLTPGDCETSARFERELIHFSLDERSDVFCEQAIPIVERILCQ